MYSVFSLSHPLMWIWGWYDDKVDRLQFCAFFIFKTISALCLVLGPPVACEGKSNTTSMVDIHTPDKSYCCMAHNRIDDQNLLPIIMFWGQLERAHERMTTKTTNLEVIQENNEKIMCTRHWCFPLQKYIENKLFNYTPTPQSKQHPWHCSIYNIS